ncbi:unnamed protein product [Blepharisma stoltei]|uniref:Paramyosin n=1 Tax=Blepharisma stoltei TaxID=1481888 RepID=A0AAU9JZD6_9CILI|nr:unnamed protein product [Blepharisma stoltei]
MRKSLYSPTKSSLSKMKNPVKLREKLDTMTYAIEELKENLAKESDVTESLEVMNYKNHQQLSIQINALKAAFEDLSGNILGQLGNLREEILNEARKEYSVLSPKLQQQEKIINVLDTAMTEQNKSIIQLKKELNDSYRYIVDVNLAHSKKEIESKTENLVGSSANQLKNELNIRLDDLISASSSKIRREVYDKFDIVNERFDNLGFELKDTREKGFRNAEELKEFTLDLRKLNLTFDSFKENYDIDMNRLKKESFDLKDKIDFIDSKRQKLDKDLDLLRDDNKRRLDTYDDTLQINSKELAQQISEIQEQLEHYQGSIKHDHSVLQNLTTQTIERVAEIKHSLSARQQELIENQEKKIAKLSAEISILHEQFERDSYLTQTGDLNLSIGNKIECLSRSFYGENKNLSEKIGDLERNLEGYRRSSQEILEDIEKEMQFKHESLSRAISKVCDYNRIPTHLIF